MSMEFLKRHVLELGAALLGVGLYLGLRKSGFRGGHAGLVPSRQVLVLYQADGDGAPEFRRKGDELAGWFRATAIPVTSGADILAAIRQAPRGLRRVIWLGHGTPRAFFRPGHAGVRLGATDSSMVVSAATVAKALSPKLAAGWILSLAGCSAGASIGEFISSTTSRTPGGQTSFAGKLRDELVKAGAPGGSVRAHTTLGHTTANPNGREFFASRSDLEQPGQGTIGLGQGGQAELWISGLA